MNSLSQETGDTEPMVKGSSETSCDTIHEATSAALEFQVTMCSITSKLQAKPLTGLAPSLLPGSCRRKDSENHSLESASHHALDHWFDQTEIKADGSQTGLVRYPETSSPQTLSLSLSLSLLLVWWSTQWFNDRSIVWCVFSRAFRTFHSVHYFLLLVLRWSFEE